jgi:O-antigen/teichoic acid export membrane protein
MQPSSVNKNLRESAINSSTWTFVGFGLSQLVRLGSNIAMAAILFQEVFALMAIVTALISGLILLSDIGLAPNIIQSKRGDDQSFLDTAWTMQVLRGFVLAIGLTLIAWPVAHFYAVNDPIALELRWLIPMVAVGVLIESFQSTKIHTAGRHLNLPRLVIVQLLSQCVGLSVMLIVALETRSVFAIPLNGIVAASVQSFLSHFYMKGVNNRFRWEWEAVKEIFHFGKWVMLSTMIFFLSQQTDKLVFARLFPFADVGVYSIAVSLAVLSTTLMARIQHAVMFPLYSRMLERGDSLAAIIFRSKAPLLTIGAYMVALSIACAASFIGLAYDSRYAAAGQYIPILAVGAWFAIIEANYGSAFLASGKPNFGVIVSLARLIIFVIILMPAIHLAGFNGAIAAVTVSEIFKLPVSMLLARRLGLRGYRTDILLTLYCGIVGFGTIYLSNNLTIISDLNFFPKLLLQFLMVTIAFAPSLISCWMTLFPRKR